MKNPFALGENPMKFVKTLRTLITLVPTSTVLKLFRSDERHGDVST